MPRQPRIQHEGAIYHLMNRGDRREPIFKTDFDRLNSLTPSEKPARPGPEWAVGATSPTPLSAARKVECKK